MDSISDITSTAKCNYSYVPTTVEYMNVLGMYGTSLLIVGGLITVGLYVLFFEQVFFTIANAHIVYRRHIYWISSVYPFMTLMSVISVVVPRAHNICTAAKVTYMSVGISHFTDLTVLMYGSEDMMLVRAEGDRLNLRVGPVCCCCVCLPSPPVTRFPLRLVLLLSDQLPFTQAAYYLTVLVLLSADNITLGNVKPNGSFLWLNLFNVASFMSGVYSLKILTYFSRGRLDSFTYKKKSFLMRTLILVTNLQGIIFDIMANYNAFPCVPPFLPPQVYKQTVENVVYVLEMVVLGTFNFWQYKNDQFLHLNLMEDHLVHHTNYSDASSADTSFTTPSSSSSSSSSSINSIAKTPKSNTTNDYDKINTSDRNGIIATMFPEVTRTTTSHSPSPAIYQSQFYDVMEQGESTTPDSSPSIIVHQQSGEQERELKVLAEHQSNTSGGQQKTENQELVTAGDELNIIVHQPNTTEQKDSAAQGPDVASIVVHPPLSPPVDEEEIHQLQTTLNVTRTVPPGRSNPNQDHGK